MKGFIKTFIAGIQVLCIAVTSIIMFLFSIALWKYMVTSTGIAAAFLFVVSVICFIAGIMSIWILGIIGEDVM